MTAAPLSGAFDLTGRVGIITGGGGILGKAIVPAVVSHGAAVVIADTNEAAAIAVAESVEERDRVLPFACDVTVPSSVNEMVAAAVRRFGKVDFLLNNAATAAENPGDYYAPFESYDLAEWRRVMSVNLDGVFLVAQAVGRQLIAQGTGGSIVQTASIYGVTASDNRIYEGSTYKGYAINNPAVYSASKAGVIGLTRWLATYWATHGIRVNAVAPGGVQAYENDTFVRNYSNRVPMGRMAQPHEITGAMIYLISDASTYVTGQCLLVDGGLSTW